MKYTAFSLACAAVVAMTSVSNAAQVEYKLYQDADGPGTFRLTASELDGPADNGGIAAFGVVLTSATTVQNMSPVTVNVDTFSQVGFNLLRSSDAASVAALSGSQDIIGGGQLIRGFGQTAGTWADEGINPGGAPGFTKPNLIGWDAELLIATGTYPVGSLTFGFNTGSPDFSTVVFTGQSGSAVISAAQIATVIPIPEPATLALAGMGLIGIVVARRRSA